jgi:hypothetical protein
VSSSPLARSLDPQVRNRCAPCLHLPSRRSSPLLYAQLAELVSACFTGIWIVSHEHQDAVAEIAKLCHDENWPLAVWNVHRGLQLPGQWGRSAFAIAPAGPGLWKCNMHVILDTHSIKPERNRLVRYADACSSGKRALLPNWARYRYHARKEQPGTTGVGVPPSRFPHTRLIHRSGNHPLGARTDIPSNR